MANWTNFEDWELVVQSGNFLVKHFEDEELKYFAVKSAAGHWAQVYRNDHPIYHLVESFINTDDESMGNILDMLITLNYTMSSVAPDQVFVEEFAESVNRLAQRIDSFEQEHRKETDEEILEQDEASDELEERAEQAATEE